MPIIRSCVNAYVRTWNRHKIRKQKERPWVVDGIPIYLYQYSDRQDFKQQADPALIQAFQHEVAGWDADEYLPRETLVWCRQQLQQIGFNPSDPPPRHDFAQPHRAEYLELRQRAILHVQSGDLPILQICERPTQENWEEWQEQRRQERQERQ